MLYLTLLLLLLILTYRYDIQGHKKNKLFWFRVIMCVFILVSGLRYHVGGDTFEYLDRYYSETPVITDITLDDLQFGKDPLFTLLNSFFYTYGLKFFWVQLIHACFVNILIFKYIKRHTKYVFASLFFYFITCYFLYNMEIMRASMSLAVCLFANDAFYEGKWVKGYLLVMLAMLFHLQACLMLLTPLFTFLRFNKKGLLILLIGWIISGIVQEMFGDMINLLGLAENLNKKVINYSETEEYGSNSSNAVGLFLYFLSKVLYVVFSLIILKMKLRQSKNTLLEAFLMTGLLFMVLENRMGLFGRYVDFYRIYFAIIYAELLVYLTLSANKKIVRLAFFRSLLVFGLMFASLSIAWFYRTAYPLYNPYSSIFDKTIDPAREKLYNKDSIKSYEY